MKNHEMKQSNEHRRMRNEKIHFMNQAFWV